MTRARRRSALAIACAVALVLAYAVPHAWPAWIFWTPVAVACLAAFAWAASPPAED